MAHFAQLDENNLVVNVIVVDNKELIDPHTGEEDEIYGVAFCKKLLGGTWKQTSYNHNFRGNFAGIGFTYMQNVETLGVASTDIFIRLQPYPSWNVNKNIEIWESPLGESPGLTTSQIDDGYYYYWDEDAYQADTANPKTVGWALTTS